MSKSKTICSNTTVYQTKITELETGEFLIESLETLIYND